MKKVVIGIFTSVLLVACGGSSSDSNNDNKDPISPVQPVDPDAPVPPPKPGSIHSLPKVDYRSARGIVEYIDFESNSTGTYTENMFDADFHNSWQNINGTAKIVDRENSLKLAVTNPKGQIKKGIWAGKDLNEFDSLYFSYQIEFGSNYDFSMGGKMPGLSGLNANVDATPDGCSAAGQKPDAGFSVRSMFRENGRAIGYFYHQNNPNLGNPSNPGKKNCGEEIDFRYNGSNFSFQRGKTYLIEQFVKMNDAHQANGIVTVHVNGHKVLERKNMMLGESRKYGINNLFFYLWHGGSTDRWAPDRDSTAYFDNVLFSTEPVSYKKIYAS